ncbi:unnamed protein product [Rhodiola kirilowii]
MASATVGSPCGACRFLRRKCAPDCIFAPYFCPDQPPETFAAIHRVFGASNLSKLLLNLPSHDRCDAVLTIGYEAQARLTDPVYGCVAHIYTLQQQVASLQGELMQMRAQLAHNNNNMVQARNKQLESQQWTGTSTTMRSSSFIMVPRLLGDSADTCYVKSSISPQSSSIESSSNNDDDDLRNNRSIIMLGTQGCAKRQRTTSDYCQFEYWSELQELALRMMD